MTLARAIVAAVGEAGARELLDVLTGPDADRAALVGRLHQRAATRSTRHSASCRFVCRLARRRFPTTNRVLMFHGGDRWGLIEGEPH